VSPAQPSPRGRPRLSSREMLEEAAFELFSENGYAGTTVEQITQRAGVSRNTFFNYFRIKSDVLWGELDMTVESLPADLATIAPDIPLSQALRIGIIAAARQFGPSRVPWALTHYELIGSTHELQASALSRLTVQAHTIGVYVASRLGLQSGDPIPRAVSYALVAAAVASAQEWAEAGPARGELSPYLATTIDPILAGFGPFLDEGVRLPPARI
jgi:AcrR family transcriptional regulator